ncbi:hypothetical protein HBH56_149730 [Parastagonospora nodorum]|uniref:Uncharacterized protein n=1 Tax=Phaeosphaeria nodorum (strain SN15 / ATCC MYA-4574 / FGSC 10173) TaxID=321614 RepID=A0A7U2EW49_PHANO|nr:hypothetical protein HBH56_149730 [Parastagonospora nodorum]QRC94210.1 hypothetical protein JI435_405360 [Parastagonospora nodorum SN15]KAH3928642.1 hypothetical protein HBH54_135630 [Parastagonospora nodorum]KAH4106516.1 hypothetical protein HBH46_069640 [Parastagonospora nodorum]KAH4142422.1 hypothetical protein HBH45_054620 [Parastagonospora nodorum]
MDLELDRSVLARGGKFANIRKIRARGWEQDERARLRAARARTPFTLCEHLKPQALFGGCGSKQDLINLSSFAAAKLCHVSAKRNCCLFRFTGGQGRLCEGEGQDDEWYEWCSVARPTVVESRRDPTVDASCTSPAMHHNRFLGTGSDGSLSLAHLAGPMNTPVAHPVPLPRSALVQRATSLSQRLPEQLQPSKQVIAATIVCTREI